MTYAEEWRAAIKRSEQFGLIVPPHQIELERRWLDAKAHAEFPLVVRDGLGSLEFEDVVVQCLAIHYRMLPVIQDWLGCSVLYTIGWIDDKTERGMFRFTDVFIAQKLRAGHSESNVNIHAWLTLPSMEIIDVALATTIGVLQKRPEMYGQVIASYADELNDIAYKPMLVGPDFLFKAGLGFLHLM